MRSKTVTGLVLALVGIGCFGAGAMVLRQGLDVKSLQARAFVKAERSCREQVVKMGHLTPDANDVWTIEVSDVADPRVALAQATSMLAVCPGKEIVGVCLGTTCGTKEGLETKVRLIVKLGAKK